MLQLAAHKRAGRPGFLKATVTAAFVAVCAFTAPARPALAAAPAGERVTNISSATYFNNATGTTETISSNPVDVVVNAVPGFTLTGDVTVQRMPGQNATFGYTVTNTGNSDLTLFPSTTAFVGDFTVNGVQYGIDSNGDGLLDPGEVIAPGGNFLLTTSTSVSLLVSGGVASSATNGQSATSVLSVAEITMPQTLSANAIVNVEAATLEIVKNVSASNVFPGDVLTYTLEVRNTSGVSLSAATTIGGMPITVDGAGVNAIILRDRIPDMTFFDGFGQTADFTPVYHLAGFDEYTFTTQQPANLSQIEDVAFILEADFVAGAQRTASFSVRVDPAAPATLLNNTATVPLPQADGSVLSVNSNLVSTAVDLPVSVTGEIIIFEDPGYSTIKGLVGFGEMIYVETRSDACNLTPGVDTIQVTIDSQPTNDREIYDAVETGANTGIFRVGPIPVMSGVAVSAGDAELNASVDDQLSATPQCDPVLESSVPVETVGVVFVSTSNQPLAGITVNLFDDNDILAASAVTDANGRFALPTMVLGTYTVRLDGLGDFSSPSAVTDFSGFNRQIDPTGSYGAQFSATFAGGRVDFDIPVDPPAVGSLSVAKTAARSTVGLGETVRYEVEVKNASSAAMLNVSVFDQLPRGFSYVAGSAAVDGVVITDPAGADTQSLTFGLTQIEAASSAILSYAVSVGPNAGQGRRVNSAYAEGNLGGGVLIQSNTARVSVHVDRRGGVFSREGTVLGKVFHDCNENDVQDDNERGIPGVQLFTEEGIYAVTDRRGRFSLPRLRARTHIIDLYDATLPVGTEVIATRVMDAGNGGSRFVSLRAGEVRSEDFAVRGCSNEVHAEITRRIEKLTPKKDKNIAKLQLDTPSGSAFSDKYEKITTTAIFGGTEASSDALEITQRTIFAKGGRSANPAVLEQPAISAARVAENAPEQPLSITNTAMRGNDLILTQQSNALSWPIDRTGVVTKPLCTYQKGDPSLGVVPQPECWIEESPVNAVTGKQPVDVTQVAINAAAKVEAQRRLDERNAELLNNINILGGRNVSSAPAFKVVEATRNLELEIVEYDSALAFLDLENGDHLARRVASVRVKGPGRGDLALSVNGTPVPENRVGQTVRKPGRPGVQALEYVAVPLEVGENVLLLTQVDPFGNERGREQVEITVSGDAERLVVVAPDTVAADRQTVFPVIVKVVDENNRYVDTPVEITLTSADGEWDVRDLHDNRPGIQSFVDGGEAVFDFRPSGAVGTNRISVESVFGTVETDIQFTADLSRPPIMVGYIEGAFKFGDDKIDIEGLLSEDKLNAFEETTEGVNGALFLKGKIKGDALLTLRYDSDKDTEERLFRDVEPDRFYPVYGDTSEQGFDAQSRGEFFVKIEKGASYVLYGDVRYGAEADAFRLGGYQRSLEGAKVHVEKGNVRLNFYAAETDATQQVVEIPALGISGPYNLDFSGVEENSETVELITRDRDEPSVIIKTRQMSRFSNYTLDYFARTLIFNAPVESVDENLNPVSIRVTFEVPNGANDKYWVYGGEGSVALTDSLSVGYRELRSDAPVALTGQQSDRRMVRAAYVEQKFGDNSKVQLEIAETEYDAEEGGNLTTRKGEAARLSFARIGEKSSVNARIAWAGENFNAPGAAISAGNLEARIQTTLKPSENTNIRTEALYAENEAQDEKRYGLVSRVEKKLNDKLSARLGARYAVLEQADDTTEPDPLFSAIAGLNWAPHFLGGATLDAEIEQALTDSDAFRVRLGTEYQVTPKMRAYVLSEWSNSDRGEFAIVENKQQNTTIRGGVEYKWTDNIAAFSEYRANQNVADAGVANGLNAKWNINENLSLRSRVEHVEPLTDVYQGNSSASLGATWQPENGQSILSGDIEYAISTASDRETIYTNATAGHKVGDTTLLLRNRFAKTEETGGDRIRDRLRVGAAHRPAKNEKINLLGWYEYGVEDTPEFKEERHIASVGVELKPADKTRIRPTIAAQSYALEAPQFSEESQIYLGTLGADQDITDRINLGANIAAITDGDAENWHLGAGVEANVVVAKNVLIGVGYNYTEVENKALEGLYEEGAYVRLRIKFDEGSWNIFED